MDGLQIDSSAVDGVLAGVGYSLESLNATMGNVAIWTIATMLIGFVIVVGLVMYLIKDHRGSPIQRFERDGGFNGIKVMQNNHDYKLLNDRKYWENWRK